MNHNSSLCHGPVLSKQSRSIPSAPLPVLVNLGSWLTEQKLIRSHVVFSTPQQRPSNQRSHCLFSSIAVSLFTERELFLKKFLDTVSWKDFVSSAAPLGPCLLFFLRLSCPPSFLIYCMPSAILPSISPSQPSVCFSPRFIIPSYQPLLVPQGFLHLISARLITPQRCSVFKRDYVLLSVH